MVAPREDKELICEEGSEMKSCVDCGATKTPLWRSGPAGPKSLCNACGIKSRKKRGSSVSGVTKSSTEEKKAKKLGTNTQNVTSSSSSNNDSEKQSNGNRNGNSSNANRKSSQMLKKNLAPLGQEVVFQRSIAERLRRRLGEDEQAAMLLLALSSCAY